jgi:F0F1-type ATP synthase assembly protein I
MVDSQKPKFGKIIEGAEHLSLGISMIVAVVIGVGIGIWMRDFFGYEWLFWLGLFWGIAGAVLNVYKAYLRQVKSYDELKDNPRYRSKFDDDDDD